MSMFGELAHGGDTDEIGKYILHILRTFPDDKDNIRKLLLPLYEKYITWDEGNCRDMFLEKDIRERLK